MPPLTRCRALQLAGMASVGGLAGCVTSDEESSEPSRLAELTVSNHDPRQYTVHVVVLEDGEPVYWDSKQASPAEDGQLGGATFEGYPTEPGHYVLHARLDDQPESEWKRFDFAEYDTPCLGLNIAIGDATDGRVGELSIWYTTSPRVCEKGTTESP